MLILTRRDTEVIDFYQNEKLLGSLRIMGFKGNQVRLGFEGMKDVLILRSEVEPDCPWKAVTGKVNIDTQNPLRAVSERQDNFNR